MAKTDTPDDPNWQRIFKALGLFATKRGRVPRELRIELHAGKNGVRVMCQEESFTPDE
jgi:hypothetical protein